MIYLDLDDLLHIASRVIGDVAVRDMGMLQAALARPAATAFGRDAYPDLLTKAAALLHSLAKNHALIDGNKRLALAATIAFLGVNGYRLRLSNGQAYDLVAGVAEGSIDDLDEITDRLQEGSPPGGARRR